MIPFLKQVAAHYFEGPEIQSTLFIFPNRRSLVFFKKYLSDVLRESGSSVPLPVPPLYTVNDFFYKVSGLQAADRLRLILELYAAYKNLSPDAEPLDEFIFWGDVLLADFDDVDKYLAPAEALMQNVGEFRSMEDSIDYLTPTQSEAIERFLSHFRDSAGLRKQDGVKASFLRLWNILFPLYRDFNRALSVKGIAYEGMVYRSLAERLKGGESASDILAAVFPDVSRYVFVGLNALNECERLLMARMRDAGLAEFVWDYVSGEIRDPANKSSLFMKKNVQDFHQAFPIDPDGLGEPEITVVSVPSSVGQTKLAPFILERLAQGSAPVETAFVLADESLLLPLLSSIPPQYDKVNVTMGYPMGDSAVFTLLDTLGRMQLRLRESGGRWYFYHRELWEVLSSGIVKSLLSEGERQTVEKVKVQAKYYVPVEDISQGELLSLIFKPVLTGGAVASAAHNHFLEEYFLEIISYIGRRLSETGDLLELDFAKRCFSQLTILRETDLEILPSTYLRTLERILKGISVPFRGEPLEGLQVMGPLETRALDFRNLVILGASENMFPRKSVSASFIPPELRRGFGLPTYEYQDAVWAYYFYRMIQRPEKVWLVYDNRTEGIRTGEESRYIKQLEYHFGKKLRRLSASSSITSPRRSEDIPKTEKHVACIRGKRLSASALQNYLSCPAKFYYQMVEGLREDEDIAESLDSGKIGNVFHHVMQRLYSGKGFISLQEIRAMEADRARIRSLVREEILAEMHSIEVSGRNLVLENIIADYVERTLSEDARTLSYAHSDGFSILGLERHVEGEIKGFRFTGYVDRIDSYKAGEVRIVDYKTGHVEDEEVVITDDNAVQVADRLFGGQNHSRPKIALQLYLYDLMTPVPEGSTVVNSIYSTARLYSKPLPEVPMSAEFARIMALKLDSCLEEIADVSVPWRRTEEEKTCEWCPFKVICGR